MHGVIVAVHDNIKRVIEFLISQGVMEEPPIGEAGAETAKLWRTTWDIVGAFFTEMKGSIVKKGE
jgi:hypothetical protein